MQLLGFRYSGQTSVFLRAWLFLFSADQETRIDGLVGGGCAIERVSVVYKSERRGGKGRTGGDWSGKKREYGRGGDILQTDGEVTRSSTTFNVRGDQKLTFASSLF